MAMRWKGTAVALLAGLGLVGCGDGTPGKEAPRGSIVADDGKVDCAIGIDGGWTHDCQVERDGDLLTLRHADGGFRRLRIVTDGRGLAPADGAERARITILTQQRIEVAVGPDRYRLPATVAGKGG